MGHKRTSRPEVNAELERVVAQIIAILRDDQLARAIGRVGLLSPDEMKAHSQQRDAHLVQLFRAFPAMPDLEADWRLADLQRYLAHWIELCSALDRHGNATDPSLLENTFNSVVRLAWARARGLGLSDPPGDPVGQLRPRDAVDELERLKEWADGEDDSARHIQLSQEEARLLANIQGRPVAPCDRTELARDSNVDPDVQRRALKRMKSLGLITFSSQKASIYIERLGRRWLEIHASEIS